MFLKNVKSKKLDEAYIIIIIINIFFAVYSLILETPSVIIEGITKIIFYPDILITDYVVVGGGIGSMLINSAIITLLEILLLYKEKVKANGSIIMALWMVTGFAFFGKNLYNVWSISLGVWLYSKFKKEEYSKYAVIGMLATALSPAVSQISFLDVFVQPYAIILGNLLGVAIGFFITPITSNSSKSTHGFNLYNMGFSAGVLAIFIMSVFRGFGLDFSPVIVWSYEKNISLFVLMMIISIFLITVGLVKGENNIENFKNIYKSSGLGTDFYELHKETAYINMGILSLFATFFVIAIGSNLNGPTLGGIFTIIGFGSLGKNLRNIIPIMFGVALSTFFSDWYINDPRIVLALLFCTGLAPIAGHFGWMYGVAAGFIHVLIVMNTGNIHGGLNLYNNGFSTGLVCIILMPVIFILKQEPNEKNLDSETIPIEEIKVEL